MSERVLIDDATIVMRSRFLSASERIISHLSWLEAHAEEIRADVRDSVRVSADKIRVTLKHLTDQMDRLPEAEWERFKVMLFLLRAQQDVLDSAEALIEKGRANVVSQRRSGPEAVAASGVASVSGGPRHLVAVALGTGAFVSGTVTSFGVRTSSFGRFTSHTSPKRSITHSRFQVRSDCHQWNPCRAEYGCAWWLLCHPSPNAKSAMRKLLRLCSPVSYARLPHT